MKLVLGFFGIAVGVLLLSKAVGADDTTFADIIRGKGTVAKGSSTPATDAAVPVAGPGATGTPTAPLGAKAGHRVATLAADFTGGTPEGGFEAGPGTNFSVNEEPIIASDLNTLGQKLKETIVGISGYRTPAHSVAVGGFPNDPHTKGKAIDFGVGGELRSSAASITEAELASVGLWRPFDPADDPNNSEVNHVELIGQA